MTQVPRLRTTAWRVGRALYRWARREGSNDPRTNGERWLLDLAASASGPARPLTFVDVGANAGDWTAAAVDAARRHDRACRVFAIEPAEDTCDRLARRFDADRTVVCRRLALSNRQGRAALWVAGRRSSLHPVDGAPHVDVPVQTLAGFAHEHRLQHIDLVKSDAEGHDFAVLEGGLDLLRGQRVDAWQFEYNHRWLSNRASLLAVFELVAGLPYRLARLSGGRLEIYNDWHFELDRFFETHYVLIRRGSPCERAAVAATFDRMNVPSALPRRVGDG